VIRAFLVVAAVAALYVLYVANRATFVQLTFAGKTSYPMPLFWLLLWTFLVGALAHALFILPERFRTWRALRHHKKSLRKMGKNLGAVISSAQGHGD